MRRLYLLVAAVFALLLFMAQTVPPAGVITQGLAKRSDIIIDSPVTYYVASGGNDNGDCTLLDPCRTYQPACNKVAGREIRDEVVIQGTAGWSGTGCYLTGVSQGQRALADGGVKLGSLRIRGARATYAPADGGSGAGLVLSATAGNRSTTCARDVWVLDGGFNDGELANKWAQITTGTGAGDRLWPIKANTGGSVTILDQGRATQPVAGSGFQIYDAPAATITGGLGQGVVAPTPEGDGITVTPAFVILAGESVAPLNGQDDVPKWISVEDFKVTGSATILADIQGPVEVKHNLSTATTTASQLVRALPGTYRAGVHRNILTGTGRFLQARYAATGAHATQIQAYNNLGPGPTSDRTLGIGSADSIWLEGNDFPLGATRIGNCANCRSMCDVWGGIRTTGENDPSTSPNPTGQFNFDGVTLTGSSGSAYTVSVTGNFVVYIDQMSAGLPASTIYNPSSGHAAILGAGGGLMWGASTVWDAGAGGDNQVVMGSTISAQGTPQEIGARHPPIAWTWDRSWAMQSGTLHVPYGVMLCNDDSEGITQRPCRTEIGTVSCGAGGRTVKTFTEYSSTPFCTCTSTLAPSGTCQVGDAGTTFADIYCTANGGANYNCTGAL